jgi:DNA-binding MarR family transcriptional regulator
MADISDEEQQDRVILGSLRENLPFLTRSLRAYIRAENAEFFGDLATEHGEIAILSVIARNPGISQNDLAATLVFKKSAITKLVKELEARGLIERAKSATDKRFNALQLTAEGQLRHDQISDRVVVQHDALFETFAEDERRQFFDLLNRLLAHLGERQARRTGTSAAIAGDGDD